MTIVLRRAGDRGWLLELPDDGSAQRVARSLRAEHRALDEVVPGHRSVLALGDVAAFDLEATATRALAELEDEPAASLIEIPVIYDGPDLDDVAGLTGRSIEEVVAIHAATTYTAAFLGFAPGFAYLVGLDARLEVSRRGEPRVRVPAGSVAIARAYSGVYPRESPGGWRLLGRTDATLFDPQRDRPALIEAGDRVRFVPL